VRGIPALRSIVAAIVAVGFGVVAASAFAAAPSVNPQPTPPPSSGGGGSSSGGGGGGGGGSSRPIVRIPTGPVAVANGRAGAVLLEATGERTRAPVAATPATTTGTLPTTTAEPPVTTAAAPVATTPAPATTAEITPPATTGAQPAAARSSGGDSGPRTVPRDGIVVLIGVLLLGIGVALRALRARERRIGLALLGFCVVYLVALAGLMTGVAGAATANPGSVGVTAGDGETPLDAPPPGIGWRLTVK
jgi:hypothetical protein